MGLVDFAYVGKAQPMKDIAYLLGCAADDGGALTLCARPRCHFVPLRSASHAR